MGVWLLMALSTLLLFWTVGVHQRLLSLRQNAVQAFGQVALLLAQRSPAWLTHSEALAAVSGGHDLAERCRAADQQLQAAVALARVQRHDAASLRSCGLALASAREVALAVLDDPHALLSDGEHAAWRQAEQSLDFALANYNREAQVHLLACERWPSRVVSWLARHRPLPTLPTWGEAMPPARGAA
ncbi:hypothetical protein EYS42_10945 [Aquabacterium lacunae]|uniref:LemA family protein n=1 Tax=Aquabacterium lacunae TaxID=2528630 RepID=A0A4Q9H2S6_9BURK|nr:hypothetical protein [Aquabacterium lacunae]TBO30208.1 hypothetical protein EYS42_10945 [Aquabacterium lacunae]